ncbi:MAG: N-acetylmuramoyl-L-alanine amidase [Defluviitaleaceae bacterium]|nr:N-acetylmuramoyl-L-alanine amidase [Defluviitaleaceae bacterium]MCL2239552.1 N-acetylmuramoyl-L-alanine amidase [Defluviitaleaceae bacterium]
MKKYVMAIILTVGLVCAMALPAFAMPLDRRVVVVDAGHGGWDPGMVSGKVDEKDINLKIAHKLQAYLELGGATVIITRLDDSDLSKSKSGDMAVRRLIANTSKADIFVSIHQNAFGNSSVRGAQVFYFNESDNSKKLANAIQEQIKEFANPSNRFQARANSNYFVLKQTEMPAVLVECGFLTNPGEKSRLLTEAYQEKIAWGIYMGIVDYFYVTPVPAAE